MYFLGFWIKWDDFYEQPKVELRGEYLFIATTTNLSQPIVCSTFSFYKQNLKRFDSCSTIKVNKIIKLYLFFIMLSFSLEK